MFSEIYYKNGWNSYIDDKIVPHFRANYVLSIMMVPKGTTKIEFKFEPSSYSIGESIAYASSIFLIITFRFCFLQRTKIKMNKVLIITYYWPPSGGSGVQRWLKFSKYLPQNGWKPIIYTPLSPSFDIEDKDLLNDIQNDVEVWKTSIWEPYILY